METLVCLQQPPFLYTTPPSPCNPRSPKLHPTRTWTWKLHAEAKGFSGPPASIPQKKRGFQKETLTTKPTGENSSGDDDDDKIPQVVFDRMIVRILISVGGPMAMGIAFLHLFGVVKEQHLWDVPLWVPALTTFITFGSSALGIAYGTLSTSWDPEKRGSVLGVEEAQQNWVEMWREEESKKVID